MENDDLVSRTKVYDFLQDSPSPSSSSSNDDEFEVDFEAARDFSIGRPNLRPSDPVFARVIPPSILSTRNFSIMPRRLQSAPINASPSLSPPPSNAIEATEASEASTKRFSPTPYSPFEVILDYKDHSSDDEAEQAETSVRNLTQRVRQETRPPDRNTNNDNMIDRNNERQRPQRLASIDTYRPGHPPRISHGTAPGNGEFGRSIYQKTIKEDLKPHAQFIVESGKTKINVSFDPPV
ncbi:MAG: hypothetical protein Q9214_007772, partial [Letrouitia sp. 1 TL-2023]